jgi:hypothetical protein
MSTSKELRKEMHDVMIVKFSGTNHMVLGDEGEPIISGDHHQSNCLSEGDVAEVP